MSTTPGVTLTGILQDATGTAMAGTVVLTLSNLGVWPPIITGTSSLAAITVTAQAGGDGSFTVTFYGNDQISPIGTFYTLSVFAPGSSVPVWESPYLIEAGDGGSGTSTYDLSTLTPLIPLNDFGASGGGTASTASILSNFFKVPVFYDLTLDTESQFTSSQQMWKFPFVRTFSLPANCVGSVAICDVAPTAAVSFTLEKNGASIGTVNFAISATTGTFSTTATTFTSGDVLKAIAPALTDNTFSGLSLTLAGSAPQ